MFFLLSQQRERERERETSSEDPERRRKARGYKRTFMSKRENEKSDILLLK